MTTPAKNEAAETIEELYGSHTPPTSGGAFLSLKDGESVRLRIQSEPYILQSTFKEADGTVKSVSIRYAWLIWNHDSKVAQIMKLSGQTYDKIKALVTNPDWGDPTTYDIHLSRAGSGMNDTQYTPVGARKSIDLTEDALTALASLDMLADAKEDVIMSLRDWIAAGKKFPGAVEADGTPVIQDLDESNPLDKI